MQHLTAEMVAHAINRAPGRLFDAHDVEKSVLRLHTVETAREIVAQAGSGEALRDFSDVFASYVDRTFGGPHGQIRRTARVHSEDLGGSVNPSQQWEKLVVQVIAPPAPTDGRDGEIEDDADIQEEERLQQAIHTVALRNAAGRMGEEP